METNIIDRGSHIEVHIGAGTLRRADIVDFLGGVARRFGAKPMLVVCDDPRHEVSLEEAYRIGVQFAEQLPFQRVAVALRGRKSTELERFTEFVAANRGARVHYFDDEPAARAWLAVA
jgi:hypothetical protein